MNDSNFLDDITEKLAGESVEGVVIGDHGGEAYRQTPEEDGYLTSGEARFIPAEKRHVVLSWEQAQPLLNYEYDDGFGGCDCHPVWVWTATRVLFVGKYDGSTWIASMPRHPIDGVPETC